MGCFAESNAVEAWDEGAAVAECGGADDVNAIDDPAAASSADMASLRQMAWWAGGRSERPESKVPTCEAAGMGRPDNGRCGVRGGGRCN